MENFTTCWLDPLRYDQEMYEEFGDCLDDILKDAIQLNQKKVHGMESRVTQHTIFFVRIYFIRISRQKFAKF